MTTTKASATSDSPGDDSGHVAQVMTGTMADGTDKKRRTVWTVLSAGVGGIVGLAPHVLHHIGPLVGTALVAGAGGTALFGVIGLVASIPSSPAVTDGGHSSHHS